tara:strand:- start:27 stop:188 length:162 start_codon:yes stop_codon:yes gene_type:complete
METQFWGNISDIIRSVDRSNGIEDIKQNTMQKQEDIIIPNTNLLFRERIERDI